MFSPLIPKGHERTRGELERFAQRKFGQGVGRGLSKPFLVLPTAPFTKMLPASGRSTGVQTKPSVSSGPSRVAELGFGC